MIEIFIKDVNPEPWTVPDLGLGRKKGGFFPIATTKPIQRAYQDAIKESVQAALPDGYVMIPKETRISLRIVVFRQLDSYETQTGRRMHRHEADATNIQKATEDALQGILFENDVQCAKSSCEIVRQETDQTPGIYITIEKYKPDDGWEMARAMMASQVKEDQGLIAWVTNERNWSN